MQLEIELNAQFVGMASVPGVSWMDVSRCKLRGRSIVLLGGLSS